MPLNSVWALDTSGLHALENRGDQNRIHLVVDVKRGAETDKYFPRLSLALILHFALFTVIASYNILRDLFIKPASLLDRFRNVYYRITEK